MENNQKAAEEYIIDESPEISTGKHSFFTRKIFAIFPALKNRNYFIYFCASLVSLIGTWLQIVAEGWLVLTLTNSAFWVGMVAALATIPTLLFSLFGGVIVDRFPKRNILIFTQSAAMVLAIIYGLLTVFHLISLFEICALAFLLGIVTAIDNPARQSFIPKIVEKDQLSSAIALAAGTFNAARVIGPSVAGILIAATGSGGAFILNGISYLPVVIALFYMIIYEEIPKHHPSPLKAIKEGIAYSFSHPLIRVLLIMTAVTSIFGWSYATMMPVIAKNTFHLDASGLGYLYAAGGLGAICATIIVSAFSKRNLTAFFILGGNSVFALSIILFTLTQNLIVGLILLFIAGFGILSQFATLNSTMQHLVDDSVRGRVMSIYTLMFIGLLPIGNFEVGFLSDKFGTNFAIRIGAIIVFIFGIVVFARRKKIAQAYRDYREENEL